MTMTLEVLEAWIRLTGTVEIYKSELGDPERPLYGHMTDGSYSIGLLPGVWGKSREEILQQLHDRWVSNG